MSLYSISEFPKESNMSLYSISEFPKESKKCEAVRKYDEVPKEMNLFFRVESDFIPKDRNIKELTQKEKDEIRAKYRFDYYVSGQYQTITGFGKMFN
jgi:hypothetical protein